ncbi:MAG: rhodanese-like domain-containing protein [Gemmatimonadota bacterium]|nr:rhodanese-like domain-containing protein [Gemmatimonadota bacterium]
MADTLDRDALKEKIDRGDHFRLIEVLSEEEYRSGHLPGAIHLPVDEIRERAPELLPDEDDTIVVYCRAPDCDASPKAVRILEELGYEEVLHYPGGKEGWEEAGYPMEGEGSGS